MKLKQLFADDDAVSPVIGVILMVAITVILAAVIASFVLGLGDQNNPAPTADFDFDYDTSTSPPQITVTHGDGDELVAQNLYIRGEELDSEGQWDTFDSSVSPGDAIAAGNSITVDTDSTGTPAEYVINVVWEDPDSDSTSTLSTDRGPDA
jgi:flagellin-like protein